MFELNRAERRALVLASFLIVGGAGLRSAIGPGFAAYSWRPATANDTALPRTLRQVRVAVKAGVAREERAARPLAPGELLDPNSASEVELRRLPGVGTVRAGAIVKARQEHAFQSPEDLLRVAGIGEALLARTLPYLSFPRDTRAGRPLLSASDALSRARDRKHSRQWGTEVRIDINAAGPEELASLPWIGPSRARRILEARRRLSRFHSVDELIEVSGIGPQILERLRPYVVVNR